MAQHPLILVVCNCYKGQRYVVFFALSTVFHPYVSQKEAFSKNWSKIQRDLDSNLMITLIFVRDHT